ncbi:SusD/RagB family nutrient-binding outer membrane lipoprotein [Rhodohalobacter sp. 614A]|uniref:SusD/RagB family nutrient-binding outer membrane lipoprotein n=1 Tax=Rhodohalobacter sp. 614A TaxID=2908649 RepID=UPI001F363319|nr:SusD/RagB family nutrient-binding outer membrane lipoprotein [Rhodohalobacter sp. 614A]
MKKLLIPFTIIAFFLSSCDVTSIDDDINKNPNLPSDADPTQLIANAMLWLPALGSAPSSGYNSTPQGEYNAQYLSQTIYVDGSLYQEGATSFYWFYQEPLINLQTAIDNSTLDNQIAVAKILKAYFIWHMTDRWGDIPYSEALMGADQFTPVYDTQESIYNSLFALLKEAKDEINTGSSLRSDVIYEGNMEQWITFSNTVRLLMALRLSEVNPQLAQQEFNAALNDGVMTSNDDSFIFEHLANEDNESFWYDQVVRTSRDWWALSEGLVSLMKPVNDPRLSFYGDLPQGNETEYIGLPFGTPEEGIDPNDYSLLGSDMYEQDAPVYLVTYAQVLFAKAEAAARGWIGEDAESNYNAAIENSLLQWTGSSAEASSFIAQPEIAYDSANSIERISEQRYVHLFLHGFEAWAEYRRTGYPANMVSPLGRDVPLRQSYTSDEALNNTENYQQAVDRQFGGENNLYGRLWWDVE